MWQPTDCDGRIPGEANPRFAPEFPSFSVKELLEKGTLLLASSGKEFVKPTGILASSSEVKKARKEAMGRLGLDFLESVGGTDEMDIEKELVADQDGDVEMENTVKQEVDIKPISPLEDIELRAKSPVTGPSHSPSPAAPSPTAFATTPVSEDTSALSARERNRLKRKRKPGNSAFVAAPPPPANSTSKFTAAPSGQANK